MIQLGQRVRVYFNLHKQCLSIMDKRTRRVIAHADFINLANVKFVVSKNGVERIRREKRKSVVAFVEGDYVHSNGEQSTDWTRAYFNPYKVDTFVIGDRAVHEADRAYVVNREVYVKESQCVSC